jgi:hypothetical protein
LQIGEGEITPAVSAVGDAEERKEGRVLGDRQDLPVAHRPADGREVEREDSNFS